MRTFVFVAAGHRYAIDASCVQAVHPLVRARTVPGAPPWLTGVIDVHGEFVPLVDAVALLHGSGSVERTLGARILLLDTGIGDSTRARFALAVDRVEDASDVDEAGAWGAGAGATPWLGAVLQHRGEPAQRFDPRLLADSHAQLAAPAGPLARRADG
jgi:chemotaxis-related protein WspB